MIDRTETVRHVSIKHPLPAPVGLHPNHLHRLLRGPFRAEPVTDRQKVGLEDRFDDQLGRRHHYAITDGGNTQRPGLTRLPSLRNVYPPQRQGPVAPGPQLTGEHL